MKLIYFCARAHKKVFLFGNIWMEVKVTSEKNPTWVNYIRHRYMASVVLSTTFLYRLCYYPPNSAITRLVQFKQTMTQPSCRALMAKGCFHLYIKGYHYIACWFSINHYSQQVLKSFFNETKWKNNNRKPNTVLWSASEEAVHVHKYNWICWWIHLAIELISFSSTRIWEYLFKGQLPRETNLTNMAVSHCLVIQMIFYEMLSEWNMNEVLQEQIISSEVTSAVGHQIF